MRDVPVKRKHLVPGKGLLSIESCGRGHPLAREFFVLFGFSNSTGRSIANRLGVGVCLAGRSAKTGRGDCCGSVAL